MNACAAAIWLSCDRQRGCELLADLIERFRENSISGVFAGCAEICSDLALSGRSPDAEILIQSLLDIVPPDLRAEAADALVYKLRRNTSRDFDKYPERRGLYPEITSSKESLNLILKLLPSCSEPIRLEVRFELAIAHGYENEEAGHRELAAVLRHPGWTFPSDNTLIYDARPWIACAAALGEEGCVRALQAFSRRPDALPTQVDDVLAWALIGSDHRRDLLYEIWATANAFGSYIR